MPSIEVEFPAWPSGTEQGRARWRIQGATLWTDLGLFSVLDPLYKIPHNGPVEIEAWPLDEDGMPGEARSVTIETRKAMDDRPAIGSLAFPAATATVDGPRVVISRPPPKGHDANEYEVEVVTGPETGGADEAVYVGVAQAGEEISTDINPTANSQDVHTRLVRKEDGRRSDWAVTTVETPAPTVSHEEDHSNDFAGGTLVATDNGVVPLEINAGDLRQKAIYAGDVTGTKYAGDVTDIFAGDAGLYWSPAIYETDTFEVGVQEDVQVQIGLDPTSHTRPTMYAGDALFPAAPPIEDPANGAFVDSRWPYAFLTNGADETPVKVEKQIAVSETTAPAFAAVDFSDHVPGAVHPRNLAYAVRLKFWSFFDKRITVDNIHVRRWIYCKSRPWCQYADAGELLYETTIGVAADTDDITVAGDDFDELTVRITWANAVASAATLYLRPNNDTGANYAAGNEIKPSAVAVAQNEIETVEVVFTQPQSGEERAAICTNQQQHTTTATSALSAARPFLWKNTADEMTTIRVLTDQATALKAGTEIRCFGKRHTQAST